MEWERPQWDDRVREAMTRLDPLLRSAPTVESAATRKKHLNYIANMLLRFGETRSSPIQSMLGYVGNYWCSGILTLLNTGPLRPSEIRRILHALTPDNRISQRMLTLNLRALERDGLIERQVFYSGRAHVEYRLTAMGHDLTRMMLMIIDWSAQNIRNVVHARARFDGAD